MSQDGFLRMMKEGGTTSVTVGVACSVYGRVGECLYVSVLW